MALEDVVEEVLAEPKAVDYHGRGRALTRHDIGPGALKLAPAVTAG